MQVIRVGTNEDGSPHYHYYAPDEHVVIVNDAATGPVTLSDGTVVDLSPAVVSVASPEHAAEVAEQIAAMQPVNEEPADEAAPPASDEEL